MKKMVRTKPPKQALRRTKFGSGGKKTGPKRNFSEEMLQETYDLVGKLGARNKDLADYFDVSTVTIEYWTKKYPIFAKAVKQGRVTNSLRVSKALYSKAIGYSYTSQQVIPNTIKEYYENGKLRHQHTEPIIVEIQKQLPPDAYAAHKYLAIIMREIWADTSHLNISHQHSGEINVKKVEELSLDELSEEVKNLLFELNMKQLSDAQTN